MARWPGNQSGSIAQAAELQRPDLVKFPGVRCCCCNSPGRRQLVATEQDQVYPTSIIYLDTVVKHMRDHGHDMRLVADCRPLYFDGDG